MSVSAPEAASVLPQVPLPVPASTPPFTLRKRGRVSLFAAPFVIIGGRQGLEGGAQLGDYVRIGAGAKILGPVKIGDFAVVGANAVVTRDVEAGTVVAGVPARELRRMEDPATEYERATGQPVPLADRKRAPKWEPPKTRVIEVPASGRNTVAKGAALRDPLELGMAEGDLLA